jgi:large subunit ribosomal protein L32
MRRSGENRPTVQTCPNCNAPRIPHRICLQCGQYNGKQVMKAKAEAAE